MTWSIIARDPATGCLGIAVATRFFAVGGRVPFIRSGVGAVATQALVNPLYGPRGLRLLEDGIAADEVVRLLAAADAGREHRQLHVMDRDGRSAARTGAECVAWCGHVIGDGFSIAGNMLAGPAVVEETARAYIEGLAALPFARRLVTALVAGEAAGGDKRGRQSAALLIHGVEEYSDLDLRVDDHVDPLAELARLEAVSRQRWTHFRKFLPGRDSPAGITDRAAIDAGIAASIAAEESR
ncbi:MAG: DUF1028 domain-containing protein [Rhodospirillales bacterium]|nr:MAG: DUF1028 domain-containing protein [Rhodospirillales bacterium]